MDSTSEGQQKNQKTTTTKKRTYGRIKSQKYYKGLEMIYPYTTLSWIKDEMKLNYRDRELKDILKKTLKKQKIDPAQTYKTMGVAITLIETFFKQLEKEIIERDVAFVFPKKAMYLYLCQNKNDKPYQFNIETRQTPVFMQCQIIGDSRIGHGRRMPKTERFGWIRGDMKNRIKALQEKGRIYPTKEDYDNHITGELKYGEQLKIYNPGSNSI